MALKHKIYFDLNKRSTAVDNLPIRMRITYSGKRLDISMGYNIDPSKWDSEAQRVTPNCINKYKQTSMEINKHLLERESAIDKIFTRFELDNITPTMEDVKTAYYAMFGTKQSEADRPIEITFFERFDEFVKDKGYNNDWTPATLTKFHAVRSHLLAFDKNITLDAFNEERLMAYVKFLQISKGMRNITVSKQIGFLKWFLRWANAKGYTSQIAYASFRPKLKSVDKEIIFLNWDELMHLHNFEIPESKQYLARVRDVFCFCCFTSLRYSDAYNLKRSDIKNGTIHITTIKTDDKLQIQLNKYSSAILDKYKDIRFKGDKALPVISNQKMNEYLKELGKLAELNDPISEIYFVGNERKETVYPKYALLGTHAGRRTFICNALAMNIPAQVVMQWTGHSDYKAMQPYIAVAEKTKAEAMDKFNQK